MSFKRRKNKSISTRSDAIEGLQFRAFSVRASSINLEKRTIDAVVATENPVLMPDFERREMVPEVLLISGAEIPASRQVPLLDSHQRKATADQLGSVRELSKERDSIPGTLHFSEAAGPQWMKVREGHITDVSAGYKILHKTFVPVGQTRTIGGVSFAGPVNVVDKWRLYEVSVLPIGADQQAKLRGFDPSAISTRNLEFVMDATLKALLVKRGMPVETSDADAQKWMNDNQSRWLAPEAPAVVPQVETRTLPEGQKPLTADELVTEMDKYYAKRAAADKALKLEITELCTLADLPECAAEARELGDVVAVRAFLVTKKAELNAADPLRPSGSFRVTGEGRSRFFADVGTALSMRAIDAAVSDTPEFPTQSRAEIESRVENVKERAFPKSQRSAGADRWKNAGLMQIAEECLRIDGVDTRGLTRDEIARASFDMEVAHSFGSRANPVLNTTGSFTNLTLDAYNKSMMVGYTEAPSTWETVMRRGESVPDFKTVNRIKLGGTPNLPIWPDDTDPAKVRFADGKEKYAVESRSIEAGFTYRLLINDDMSALTRAPAILGNSAKRTVNAFAWSILTSNPKMGDGVALFSAATGARKRSNLTTGTNLPTTANIQVSQNLMMQMRGENTPEGNEGSDVLALMPKFIVGPSALYQSIIVLTRSSYDPVSSTFQYYNTASQLTAVIEPLLDADSAVKWYLFADKSQIDTIEVSFMQGQETPIVRAFVDPRNLSQNFTVLQTYGGAALNHRGIQQQQGS